jgi:hypothetical protein
MKKLPAPPKNPARPCREETLYPQAHEYLARRRYGTEQLRGYLEVKKNALRQGDFAKVQWAENSIARVGETVAIFMERLSSLLKGQSLADFAEGLPGHLKDPLLSIVSEVSRLEWLCLKELREINAFFLNAGGRAANAKSGCRRQSLNHKSARANA